MQYYAAPMEGITTHIYRQAHARWFGGIDKYFTPFIAGKRMTTRETRDILPENNTGLILVPQILTNKTADFLSIAERIASYGYDTVNLNLGCPSGTVTAKKRGAGCLSDPDALDTFLYEIYEKCPLKISIKTRLGVSDMKEWSRLLDIYGKYPVQELIIHTRLLQEFYTGKTHPEAYMEAGKRLRSVGIPLCYNGDIVSEECLQDVLLKINSVNSDGPYQTSINLISSDSGSDSIETDKIYSHSVSYGLNRIMIGRGLLKNPILARQLRQSQKEARSSAACHSLNSDFAENNIAENMYSLETLRAFHDEILDGYRQIMSGDLPVLFKMKDLWTYMITCFAGSDSARSGKAITPFARLSLDEANKHLKKIRKAERLSEYKIAVDSLFRMQYL